MYYYSAYVDPEYNSRRFALIISVIILFLIYQISYMLQIFFQNAMTKSLKRYSNDVSHKYVYGVMCILIGIVLVPNTFFVVMAYFFFFACIASIIGHILKQYYILLITNGVALVFTFIMAFTILVTSCRA